MRFRLLPNLAATGLAGTVAFLQRNFADSSDDSQAKPLPAGSRVLVVGAGVVGVSTAYELARRGYEVRCIEASGEVCGTASASWGNAGTLGISKQTAPLSAAPRKIIDSLLSSSAAKAPGASAGAIKDGRGVYFDAQTLRDPYFWLWGLTYLRSAADGKHRAFLNANWQQLNAEAQRAVFEVAAAEGLTAAADMRIDGRGVLKTATVGAEAAAAGAQAAAGAGAAAHTADAAAAAAGAAAGAAARAEADAAADAPEAAAGESFVPDAAFAGARRGYVFKAGEQGLGYYRDLGGPPNPFAEALRRREPAVAIPASQVVAFEEAPSDGQGSCAAFTQGLAARCASAYGVRFDVGIRATSLLTRGQAPDGSARVNGVLTASGEEIVADAVVLCVGANAAPLAATAQLYVPVQPLRGYSLTCAVERDAATAAAAAGGTTADAAAAAAAQAEQRRKEQEAVEKAAQLFGIVAVIPPPPPSVRHHLTFAPSSLYVTRLGDTLRFTCFGEMSPCRMDGPGPPTAELQAALRSLVEAEVPNVRELCDWGGPTEVGWHGSRPLTPDCYPMVGRTRVPGLYLNVGHSFNGWREATLSARVLGEILAEGGSVGGAAPVGPADGSAPGGGGQRGEMGIGMEHQAQAATAAAPGASSRSVLALAARACDPTRFQPWRKA
jgi:glycine/D-amino acid oxidase-like deaminating enzyme